MVWVSFRVRLDLDLRRNLGRIGVKSDLGLFRGEIGFGSVLRSN